MAEAVKRGRMAKVTIDEIDIPTPNPAQRVVPLLDSLVTDDLAINYYELALGQQFGFDVHRHNDQEEVFYVQAGTVTFELAHGEIEVGPGEVIRFATGDSNGSTNNPDESLLVRGELHS